MASSDFQSTIWTRVEEAGRGEQSGLEYLADRYYWPLRSVLVRFLNTSGVSAYGENLIDDIIQSCFLKLIQDKSILRKSDRNLGNKFRSFLCGVAIGLARNELRKLRVRGVPGSGQEHESVEVLHDTGKLPANTKEEDEGDTRAWRLGVVRTAITQLEDELNAKDKGDEAQVLRQALVENQQPKVIAENMNWDAQKVYRVIFECRRRIRRLIESYVRDYVGKSKAPEEMKRIFDVNTDAETME